MLTNNEHKIRSSCINFDSLNIHLPRGGQFSDIDMFHVYKDHRLFIELKHFRAYNKPNHGVSYAMIHTMYVCRERGEFGLILWGDYRDVNKHTPQYYSEFIPQKCLMFSPIREKPRLYESFGTKGFKGFLKYWADYVDDHTPTNPYYGTIEDKDIEKMDFNF